MKPSFLSDRFLNIAGAVAICIIGAAIAFTVTTTGVFAGGGGDDGGGGSGNDCGNENDNAAPGNAGNESGTANDDSDGEGGGGYSPNDEGFYESNDPPDDPGFSCSVFFCPDPEPCLTANCENTGNPGGRGGGGSGGSGVPGGLNGPGPSGSGQSFFTTCSVTEPCTGATIEERFTFSTASGQSTFQCPAFFTNSRCEECANPPCRPREGFSGDLSATPIVRQGEIATLTWSQTFGSCRILSNREAQTQGREGVPQFGGQSGGEVTASGAWQYEIPAFQSNGTVASHPINESTTFTLQCSSNGTYENVDRADVNVVPIFREF